MSRRGRGRWAARTVSRRSRRRTSSGPRTAARDRGRLATRDSARRSLNKGTPGEAGFAVFGVLAALLVVTVAGAVLVLAVLVGIFAPVVGQGCEALDGSGEPVGPGVGSLGEIAGSGITGAELQTVRSSPLAGSTLTAGVFGSTAYGPPWGGLQGPGVATSGGVRIDGGAPRKYLIATDPRVIALGQWVYAWPNPFGWAGAFLAADAGGRIKGRRIDFYDWRGRAYQNRWNQQTTVSDHPAAPDPSLADGGIPTPGDVGDVNTSAAQEIARQLSGQPVGFALVDDAGRVIASTSPNATNRSASITKAMILIALTVEARARSLTTAERDLVAAMIRRSDNQAANALFASVGAAAVEAVARHAGMTRFELVRRKQTPDGFILGYSRVSAVDQARLFARIEKLAPARHRAFAMTEWTIPSSTETGLSGFQSLEMKSKEEERSTVPVIA